MDKIEIGQTFSYWTVISDSYYGVEHGHGRTLVLCRCVCGKEKPIQVTKLQKAVS